MLVATTVIEVGVDVPNATLMIVEGAERFGLAQLHQLRGRVGRGTGKSTCLLIRGQTSARRGRARLALMRETNDGFRIAEEDLRLRGPGEILGTRQSGEVAFRVARPEDVEELAPIAQSDAQAPARPRRRACGPARAGGADLPLSVRARPGGRPDPERLATSSPCFFLPRLSFTGSPLHCDDQPGVVDDLVVQPHRAFRDLALGFLVGWREAKRGQRMGDG